MSTFPFNTDPSPPAQHAQTGRTLADRYLLLEKIGDGGTAEVFRARDERLGRLVALKLLRPQFVSDATWRKRFEAEARAAAGLSHPNIVDIYDVGEGPDGTLFIAMQYVEGPDLKAVLWKRGRLSPGEVIGLSRQVCAALAVAHRAGLIHRDVKPQNILIDAEGNARLTDFGIVKALAAPALTQSGMTFGTAAYLSPEQATGVQVGPASDIYALGCVMYEMLSGAPPFTGDNPTTIAYKQVWEQPRPLHELVPEVPPSLESVVMRCLNKDAGSRYPSAQALALDLERAGETHNQPTTQQPSLGWTAQPSGGKEAAARSGAAAAGVVPLVAPAPLGSQGVQTVPAASVQTAASPATQAGPRTAVPQARVAAPYVARDASGVRTVNVPGKRSTAWLAMLAVVALLGLGLLGFLALRGNTMPGQNEGTNPPAPGPTNTVAAQAPAFSPTSLVQVGPAASATASPTVLVAVPTDTEVVVPTDTPVPPTEVPPTDTPVPPPTDTPLPPPPTDTPLPPPPTDTPLPPPPTDTPVPPPTETPIPLPPIPAPTDTPLPPEPTATAEVTELERVVDEVIANNPQAVADYFDGRREALLILLNDLRERAKDRIKININEAREVLVRKLEELRP